MKKLFVLVLFFVSLLGYAKEPKPAFVFKCGDNLHVFEIYIRVLGEGDSINYYHNVQLIYNDELIEDFGIYLWNKQEFLEISNYINNEIYKLSLEKSFYDISSVFGSIYVPFTYGELSKLFDYKLLRISSGYKRHTIRRKY